MRLIAKIYLAPLIDLIPEDEGNGTQLDGTCIFWQVHQAFAGEPIPRIAAALEVRLESFQCRNRRIHSARVGQVLTRHLRCMAKGIHKPPEFQTVCNRQRASADRVQKLLKLRGYFALMLLKH